MRSLLLILFVFSILSTGCSVDEYLESESELANRRFGRPTNIESLESILFGSYWQMAIGTREKRWLQPITHYMMWNTLASDAFTTTDKPTISYQNRENGYEVYNRILDHFEEDSYQEMYRICYTVISNLNQGIELIEEPGIELIDQIESNENIYKQYVGEYYTMRAFLYFMLSQVYGPKYIPGSDNATPSLILKTRNTADFGNIFRERSTVAEVYDLMISDLNIAIDNISNTKNVGRFNKSAAHALLSRIYLDMNDWQKVEEHTTAAMVGFDLEAKPIDAFNHTDLSVSQEVIFETQNSIGHNWTGERHYSYISENSPSWISHWNWIDLQSMGRSIAGGNDYSVEGTIYRTYPISYSILRKIGWMESSSASLTEVAENDLRYQQLYHWSPGSTDYRMEFVALERPEDPFLWVFKAARSANDTSFNGNLLGEEYYNLAHAQNGTGLYDGRAHLPLIRVSEMYLSRAIARLKLGRDGEALDDLNFVKAARWDFEADPFVPFGGGGQILEEEIEKERIKELLGEGDRLFYLKAMRYDIPIGDSERRTDISIGNVSFPYHELFWELPPVETDANPNVD